MIYIYDDRRTLFIVASRAVSSALSSPTCMCMYIYVYIQIYTYVYISIADHQQPAFSDARSRSSIPFLDPLFLIFRRSGRNQMCASPK